MSESRIEDISPIDSVVEFVGDVPAHKNLRTITRRLLDVTVDPPVTQEVGEQIVETATKEILERRPDIAFHINRGRILLDGYGRGRQLYVVGKEEMGMSKEASKQLYSWYFKQAAKSRVLGEWLRTQCPEVSQGLQPYASYVRGIHAVGSGGEVSNKRAIERRALALITPPVQTETSIQEQPQELSSKPAEKRPRINPDFVVRGLGAVLDLSPQQQTQVKRYVFGIGQTPTPSLLYLANTDLLQALHVLAAASQKARGNYGIFLGNSALRLTPKDRSILINMLGYGKPELDSQSYAQLKNNLPFLSKLENVVPDQIVPKKGQEHLRTAITRATHRMLLRLQYLQSIGQ